jgi:branched-chain amino acid transport system substrate-binding protein
MAVSKTLRGPRIPISAVVCLLALAAALVAAGCGDDEAGGGAAAGDGAQDVKIGVVLAQTGDLAVFGRTMMFGLEMARDELAEEGVDGANLSWVVEDNEGDRAQAIRVFQKFIGQDQTHAVIGPLTSTEMFTVGPIADEAGLIAFGTATTAPGIADIGDFVFNDAVGSAVLEPRLVETAVDMWQPQGVAIIACTDDEAMQGEYEIFKKAFTDAGVQITADEKCQRGDLDFRRQLTKIGDSDYDTFVIVALGQDLANIARQAKQIGVSDGVNLLGALPANDPQWVKLSEGGMEGMHFMGAYSPSVTGNPRNDAFVKAYTERYDEPPTQFAAQTYDGVYLLADAIERAELTGDLAKDRVAIKDALAATKDFDGVLGMISADPVGNLFPADPGVVLTVKDGKIMPAEGAE